MAGIRQFIAQKIRHPSIRTKWIETMYMTDDGTGDDIKIYWHGIPADNNVIKEKHLAEGAVTTNRIRQNAVRTINIDDKAVTKDKLDDDLKADLNATVANGILNLPKFNIG